MIYHDKSDKKDVELFLHVLILPKSIILEKDSFSVWGLESVWISCCDLQYLLSSKLSDFTVLGSIKNKRSTATQD